MNAKIDTKPIANEAEIEVTPEMTEAGLVAFYKTSRRFHSDEEIVARIYRDMRLKLPV